MPDPAPHPMPELVMDQTAKALANLALDLRPGPFQPLGGWAHAIPPEKRDAILALLDLVDVLTARTPTPGRNAERGHANGYCCTHCQSTSDSTMKER